MKYELRYQEQSIGIITNVEKDFPSYWGNLTLVPDWADILDEDALAMVSIGLGKIDEDDLSEEQYASLCEWLMETEDWVVVNLESSDTKSEMILPPSFRPNYVTWRFM